jgi:hypothetical protein
MNAAKKIVIIAGPNGAGKSHPPNHRDGRQPMSTRPQASKDPDILAAPKALRRAARRALQIGLETGTPVYVLDKGQIIDLTREHKRPTRRNATEERR